ncbi:MAG: hypothetical protein ACXWP4_28015 [Polyangiales bacterium]
MSFLVVSSLVSAAGGALADETAAKQVAQEKPNEAERAKEGATTALPSVAGRPVRRYAEKNVLELGGAISFVKANSFTQIGATPTFGWFFIDYVELSVLPSAEWVKTFRQEGKGRYSFILEPSFHISIGGPIFAFFGAGVGVVYEAETGTGLAIAPRTGINVLIGGSGVLNLALSYEYTATKRTAIEDGSTDPHTSTFGIQSGYSVAW